jgi:GT2 family glycosyltransferase
MNNGRSDLAVVVVNFGSSSLLRRNLAPLARSLIDATIVVVDNFSTAEERAAVRALGAAEGWTVDLAEGNRGFGAGMNRGVEVAGRLGARFFLLLNPDAVLAAADVDALLRRVRRRPDALVAPRIVRPDGSLWSEGDDLYLDDGRIRAVRRRGDHPEAPVRPWLSGACLLLSEELWRRVGGFDERYFLYWEDVDLSWRVVAAGGELEICDDASATHDEGGTQGTRRRFAEGSKSNTYYYYNVRNRLLFGAIHLTDDELRRWLRVTRRVSREILLQGGRRQFLVHPLGPLSAMRRGMRDGRRVAAGRLRGQSLGFVDASIALTRSEG